MTAARLLQQAVDQGCTSACVRLADLLLGVGGSYSNYDESGYQGVPLDDESGVRLMALAAEAGHPLAQYNVGFMLSRGTNGLKRRPLAAMAWFAHAVSNGNEAAKKEANYKRNVAKAGVFEDYTEFYTKRGTDTKQAWAKDVNLGHRMAKTKYDWSGKKVQATTTAEVKGFFGKKK